MKKNLTLVLFALISIAVLSGCGSNKLSGNYMTTTSVLGMEIESTLIFDGEKVTEEVNGDLEDEGTYTIEDGILEIKLGNENITAGLAKDKKSFTIQTSDALIDLRKGLEYTKGEKTKERNDVEDEESLENEDEEDNFFEESSNEEFEEEENEHVSINEEEIEEEEEGNNQTYDTDAEEYYKKSCAACHGGDLTGLSAPNISEVGYSMSASEIEDIIINGKGAMPAGLLPEDEAREVAEWLAEME